jgi:glutathione S-transferase
LCEELEIPYHLVRYARDPVTNMAPADYKKLHPIGTAPVITEGDLTLGESGAIIEYIIARHGGGRLTVSAESPNFADYLYWFHFANGAVMPAIMGDMILAALGIDEGNAFAGLLRARTEGAFRLIEQRLGETDYFAGSAFTAADIMMLFPLTTMRFFLPRDLSPFPNLRAYLKRIGERAAYQRAMAKGDPELPSMTE